MIVIKVSAQDLKQSFRDYLRLKRNSKPLSPDIEYAEWTDFYRFLERYITLENKPEK